jgi:hypothetical protein
MLLEDMKEELAKLRAPPAAPDRDPVYGRRTPCPIDRVRFCNPLR